MAKRKAVDNADDGNQRRKAEPKTLKDKISAILDAVEHLTSLAALKKLLNENYDIESNATNNKKLSKALQEMCEQNLIGKVGGSYHGGPESPSCLEHNQGELQKQAEREQKLLHASEMCCPWCLHWMDAYLNCIDDDLIRSEDILIRIFKCANCSKEFYSGDQFGDDNGVVGRKIRKIRRS
jgi:hypothetical protein